MHIIAAKAVALKEALGPAFAEYQKKGGPKRRPRLAQGLSSAGFRLVSGGTDNHMMLIDVSKKGLTGKDAEKALEKAGITTNKNAIPFDPKPPKVTSGLRLGTPALTSRGMGLEEMDLVAGFISDVLSRPDDESFLSEIKQQVSRLCQRFPLYQELNAGEPGPTDLG